MDAFICVSCVESGSESKNDQSSNNFGPPWIDEKHKGTRRERLENASPRRAWITCFEERAFQYYVGPRAGEDRMEFGVIPKEFTEFHFHLPARGFCSPFFRESSLPFPRDNPGLRGRSGLNSIPNRRFAASLVLGLVMMRLHRFLESSKMLRTAGGCAILLLQVLILLQRGPGENSRCN
ncbi:hypothetical protein BDV12DRAFT_107666 [Aspergillus spectabilis]